MNQSFGHWTREESEQYSTESLDAVRCLLRFHWQNEFVQRIIARLQFNGHVNNYPSVVPNQMRQGLVSTELENLKRFEICIKKIQYCLSFFRKLS